MIKLSRFQIAAIKRTAANTKKLVKDKERLGTKIADLVTKITELDREIENWESPIKSLIGSYTVEEILNWGGNVPENEEDEAFLNLQDSSKTDVIIDELVNQEEEVKF